MEDSVPLQVSFMTLTFNQINYFEKRQKKKNSNQQRILTIIILCELQISRTCSQKYFCYTLYIIHNCGLNISSYMLRIYVFLALVFFRLLLLLLHFVKMFSKIMILHCIVMVIITYTKLLLLNAVISKLKIYDAN